MTSRGFGSSGAVPCARRRGARGARLARRANFSSKLAIFLRFNDTGHRTSHHEPPRRQERVSRRRQSKRDKTRRLERGNERRSSVPIRVDLSGQPPSTYTDRASAQWTRTAQILSVAPVSSHQDDSRTRSGGLRNVQSGSVWAARDRQRAVCVLFLAARPRFYEIIRDHPRSFTSSTWRRSRSPCRPRQ